MDSVADEDVVGQICAGTDTFTPLRSVSVYAASRRVSVLSCKSLSCTVPARSLVDCVSAWQDFASCVRLLAAMENSPHMSLVLLRKADDSLSSCVASAPLVPVRAYDP